MTQATTPSPAAIPPTPLGAILLLSFMASVGTGVIWNGIFFIAQHEYGFSQRKNLLLSFTLGASYVAGAATAGRIMRRLERWLTPRAALGVILGVQAAFCFGPLFVDHEWMIWMVSVATTVLASFLWPIVESYLTSGRHGHEMRSAIGRWNLVWMGAVASSLLFMAPLLASHARLAIVGLGVLSAGAIGFLYWFTPRPGTHDADAGESSITEEYPLLLKSARVLLPLSYMLNAAMAPLLPYRLSELGIDSFRVEAWDLTVSWQTPAVATWMVVRTFAAAVMWKLAFWHGRWGTLLAGGVTLVGGFALVVVGPHIALVLLGFAIYGVGMGVIYFAALYYAMAVGGAEIDAGGTHEALIGLGYTVGPAATLIGLQASTAAGPQVSDGAAIVVMITVLVALGTVPAWRPYLAALRKRRR